jgi:integrase
MTSIKKRITAAGEVRYDVRYRTPSGDERRETFKREVDAKRRRTDIDKAIDSGGYIDRNRARVTVGVMAEELLASKVNLAPKTRDRYEQIVRAHIKPRWDKVPLGKVTHGELQRWIAGIDAAPATVRKVHQVMSQLLAYAVADDRLAKNPAERLSLPRVRQAEKRFLTHQQVAEMAEAVGPEYRLVVLFLAYTGLRWGEMAALRVNRLDFLRRRALIAESVTPIRGVMTFGPTKGHERREVPLPTFLLEELAAHVRGKAADDPVFIGERGGVMRSQTFQRAALTEAAAALGVPGFHPHELRHSAASLAIASGADVKVVQQMLGHKSAVMTLDQYGHLFGDRLDVVADAMDAARTAALGDVSRMRHGAEVIQLRES